MGLARAHVKWDAVTAANAVRAAVATRKRLFANFPEYDPDEDLFNEALWYAKRYWKRYDPSRGAAPFTYIYGLADLFLLMMLRSLNRRLARERRVAKPAAVHHVDRLIDEPDFTLGDSSTHLLADTYRRARLILRQRGVPLRDEGRRGRKLRFDRAQATALSVWMERQNLSCRGAELLLRTRPDLQRAIGLTAVPHYCYFSRLKKSVAQIGQMSAP
jgi:hypothetical protein